MMLAFNIGIPPEDFIRLFLPRSPSCQTADINLDIFNDPRHSKDLDKLSEEALAAAFVCRIILCLDFDETEL